MKHYLRAGIVAAALLLTGCAVGQTESEEDAADDGGVAEGTADDAREGETVTDICGDGCGDDTADACDASASDACACLPGATRSCYSGPAGTSGVGVCRAGTQTCIVTPSGVIGWNACAGEVFPGAEDCGDATDNDCDGTADEGCTCTVGTTQFCYTGPDGTAGIGACRQGIQTCIVVVDGGTDWGMCLGEVLPTTERCDAVDNDCDAELDEGCVCTVGDTESCYSGPAGTEGVGTCHGGTRTCTETPGAGTSWGACSGEVLPRAELCANGADEDCDGVPDDGCGPGTPYDTCATGLDVTAGGVYTLSTCGADNTVDLSCGTPGTPDVFLQVDSGASGCTFLMTITPGFAAQFVPSLCSGDGGCGPWDGTFSLSGGGGGWIWYIAVEEQAGGCGEFTIDATGC